MELQKSYGNGYLYEKNGNTYLSLTCSKCGESENIWIIAKAGMVRKKCGKCGRENCVELRQKGGGE